LLRALIIVFDVFAPFIKRNAVNEKLTYKATIKVEIVNPFIFSFQTKQGLLAELNVAESVKKRSIFKKSLRTVPATLVR